jgi:hypothetical protein
MIFFDEFDNKKIEIDKENGNNSDCTDEQTATCILLM